jgi:hypothetical protein
MTSGQGMLEGIVWDDAHQVVLGALAGTAFIKSIDMNTQMSGPELRVFTVRDRNGTQTKVRVNLSTANKISAKAPSPDRGEGWTRYRIYRADASRLAAERRLVQYKPVPGQQDAQHEKAIKDIQALINQHGQHGACLWDPYLSAEDILQTLVHCMHRDANLRALSAGEEQPTEKPARRKWVASGRSVFAALGSLVSFNDARTPPPAFASRESDVLERAVSNPNSVKLEFRVK